MSRVSTAIGVPVTPDSAHSAAVLSAQISIRPTSTGARVRH